MRACLYMLILIGSAITSFGQAYIKGKTTGHGHHLPFVAVLLLNTDSTLVKGVISDTLGNFIFDSVTPGQYLISCSMLGYARFTTHPISAGERDIVLPDIKLEEISKALGEVMIQAAKPVFEQHTDRLVVNVQNSITSSGNTILEVLQKSPGIVVNRQSNSISMHGKSGVRLMIDGRIMQMPLEMVIQMLDGMNASLVDKIEIVATPPSNYDAEGSAGIIHIRTKENASLGTNGSAGVTLGAHWVETLGVNVNLTHRSHKFAFALDYALVRNHNRHSMKMHRQMTENEFVQIINASSRRENITSQQNLSASFEYKLSARTRLSLLFTGFQRKWDLDALTQENKQIAPGSTMLTHLNIHESNNWKSATSAIGLQTQLNSKSKINFNLDYLYYHNKNPSSYDNIYFYEQANVPEISKIDLKKNTPIRFLTGNADYQYHFSSAFRLEAGVKAVYSALKNDVLAKRLVNDRWTIDPVFSSYSTLREQVGAAYISTSWQAGRQWQVNSGLRYEFTHSSISTPSLKNLINRKYGYWFPSILIKKELGKEKDVQLSYSRRITRPTYNDMAPYVFFWGTNTFSAGNTSLWPAVADALKVGYRVRQWNLSLQYSHSQKEITVWQPETDSLSNLIYRSQNLRYLNTLGLASSYSFKFTSWWEAQSNLTALYQVAQTSHLAKNTRFNLFGMNLSLMHILKLPKDFAIEVSGMYQSRSWSGIAEYLPMGSLNAGIGKKLGKGGTLQLAMDDIFNTTSWRIKTHLLSANFHSYFHYNFYNRFIRLTYTRRFGNHKLPSVKLKPVSEDERSRIGN